MIAEASGLAGPAVPRVVVIGTLDTKKEECTFASDCLRRLGCRAIIMDTGIFSEATADVSASSVAEASGHTLLDLRQDGDRGMAVRAMAEGAATLLARLQEGGEVDAVLSLGGSGGTFIGTAAMRALPFGVPKLMLSTVASGDVGSYVMQSDITMMYSVADIAGLNQLSRRVIANAAAAIAGMAREARNPWDRQNGKGAVAMTMFGITTPAVTLARRRLEAEGYEVVVFHANGAGGRAMESLIADGKINAVLDLTTTELADEVAGGVLSAGPTRLEMAGAMGLPQVVSLGALDTINFRQPQSLPERMRGRRILSHNPDVTLVRTDPDEAHRIGEMMGRKLSAARGPVAVGIPRGGLSLLSTKGGPFEDRQADTALIDALLSALPNRIEIIETERDLNDPAFVIALTDKLDEFLRD